MFGNQEQADGFRASIVIGHSGKAGKHSLMYQLEWLSGLERGDMEKGGLRYSGAVAHYNMKREDIRGKGLVLAVADEVLRSCKVGNVTWQLSLFCLSPIQP